MRRPGDAEAAQAVKANRDCAVASAERHEEVHPQAGQGRQLRGADRAIRQFEEARFRFRQRAGEELAFGPIELEREGEIWRRSQASGGTRARRRRIGQRRGVGGRGLGAAACNEVQLGEPLALLARADERGPAVKLADDLEDASSAASDGASAVSRRPMARCAAARSASGISAYAASRTRSCGNGMPPPAATEPGLHRRSRGRRARILAPAFDEGEGGDRRTGAETGQPLQDGPGRVGQTAQLAEHEIRDIVGVAFGAYPLEVPSPASRVTIEHEQPFLGQCGQKLDREERISGGLLMHKPGERRARPDCRASATIRLTSPSRSGFKTISRTRPPACADRRQPPYQGMRGRDLVIPIGADRRR